MFIVQIQVVITAKMIVELVSCNYCFIVFVTIVYSLCNYCFIVFVTIVYSLCNYCFIVFVTIVL